MPHEVILGAKAKRDRNEIWLYIAQDNIAAADRLLDRFDEVFLLISDNPHAGPSRPDLGENVRTFTANGHVICYRVSRTTVDVAAIFHGARNITRRLLEE